MGTFKKNKEQLFLRYFQMILQLAIVFLLPCCGSSAPDSQQTDGTNQQDPTCASAECSPAPTTYSFVGRWTSTGTNFRELYTQKVVCNGGIKIEKDTASIHISLRQYSCGSESKQFPDLSLTISPNNELFLNGNKVGTYSATEINIYFNNSGCTTQLSLKNPQNGQNAHVDDAYGCTPLSMRQYYGPVQLLTL